MAIKDIIPKFGRQGSSPVERAPDGNPLKSLQREMNRLFDDFFEEAGWLRPLAGLGERDALSPFNPRVDVAETDKDVTVSVELPGMDKGDVTVEFDDSDLILRGEKKSESEQKGKRWYRREQSYGSFQRVVHLPASVDTEKAKASFKKGVLKVTVDKRPGEASNRRIIDIATD